jgi:eukaryotic-like serine/threonine-protein kinase
VRKCPQCKTIYQDSVNRCPADGAVLPVRSPAVLGDADALERTTASSPGADKAGGGKDRRTAAVAARVETGAAPDEVAASAELVPGSPVGEYQVNGKIGEGGMGEVYSGVHPVIGKKVAIKVLSAALSQDSGIVQRFVQEARAVNQIGHRNIVDIFAFGKLESGRSYFVMEFLAGRSLRERLAAPPPISYDEGLMILVEVCLALHAAHAEKIVHRDLKPDNIFLVESKAGERTVKLLDFGIAKLLEREDGGALRQTRTGQPIGTPLYMSPEQCLGRDVDWRTDIYSLGVVLFEMFTGRLPFTGPSYIETVTGHISQQPPRPRDLADIPEALEALILRCMDKEAGARPQTVEEVRSALQQIARDLGVDLTRQVTGAQALVSGNTPMRRTPPSPSFDSKLPRAPSPARARRRLPVWQVFVASGVFAGALAAGAIALKRSTPPTAPAEANAVHDPAPLPQVELQVVSDPPGAIVIIDGKKQALVTPTLFRVPRARRYVVRIEKDGWRPHQETVELADGESQRAVSTSLQPAQAPRGELLVRTGAKRASWQLDGAAVGDGSGVLALKDVPAGIHKIAVEAKGFARREETVVVSANQLSPLEWTLAAASPGSPRPRPATPGKPKPKTGPATGDDSDVTSGWPPQR